MDALVNERIRYVVIKEPPIRLSVALELTKDSEKVWKKTRNSRTRVQGQEELGSRKNSEKKTCNYEGHRSMDYPTKWELPPNYDEPKYTRCGQNGHQTKWYGIRKKRLPGLPITRSVPGRQNQGNPNGPSSTKSKREGGPCKNKRDAMLGM